MQQSNNQSMIQQQQQCLRKQTKRRKCYLPLRLHTVCELVSWSKSKTVNLIERSFILFVK